MEEYPMSDTLTLYKLILLFILDKVDFPLTNAQISGFILEKGYTNFFNVQKSLNELEETGLIKGEAKKNTSLFYITPAGSEALTFFKDEISPAIKEDILEYLKENRYEMRAEFAISADYYEAKRGEYLAQCYVLEGNSKIIELSLSLPTEETAKNVCQNWKKKNAEIYEYLMGELL
jgi:DNA-binding PadR family transcriptional regulator